MNSVDQKNPLLELRAALPQEVGAGQFEQLWMKFKELSPEQQTSALEQFKAAPKLPREKQNVPLATRLGTFGYGLPEIKWAGAVVDLAYPYIGDRIKVWEAIVGKE